MVKHSLIILLILLGIGCKKDHNIENEINNIEETAFENQIKLTYPLNNSILDFCCTFFEWEAELDSLSLHVSPNKDFEHNTYQSLIFENVNSPFEYTHNFASGEMVYWKVYNNEVEAIDSFFVKDILDGLSGEYSAIATKECYFVNTCDTTFQTIININVGSSNAFVNCDALGISTGTTFLPYYGNEHTLYYANTFGDGSLRLDFESDSIRATICQSCGNGGGTRYHFKAKM